MSGKVECKIDIDQDLANALAGILLRLATKGKLSQCQVNGISIDVKQGEGQVNETKDGFPGYPAE